MRFLMALNHHFLRKVTKSDPKKEPKRAPKPPKRTLLDLTKHMVFTVWIAHGADSGDLWEHIFLALLSGHCFFVFFCDFWRFGMPNGSPKGGSVFPGEVSKFDPAAKRLPKGSRPPRRSPKECPEVAKCHQKPPQIYDFGAQASPK